MRTLIAAAALAALAACGQQTTTEETPDTTADTMTTPAPAPAPAVTITEADARTRLEAEGYTNITGLMQNPDGTWSATGTRNGETTQVTVGESGVTVMTTPAPTTP
ncbi:MAG TPA: hypothetical protein VEA80_06200 [Vitreimonas sp.]|uniref:hypothetical protein n=1 Tax=Vitreimonas sp. TaxID=3069702 RepID=UPI002D4C21C2|nr:hypothetical protein [Vitreimonas sp.]HYD87045.1 hypothetical protein [Vitreimonas sp.]